jgi:dTDP-glucose 4,6-dehydratase
MKKILVTGGCGFIGSNFIRYVLQNSEYTVVNLDALTYAGNYENLRDMTADPRYRFVHGSIEDIDFVNALLIQEHITHVVHFAAETHVDRSIMNSLPFSKTNVLGTHALLDAAKSNNIEKFIHISTDEVYGSLGPSGLFTEDSRITPNSPYSASKAGSDLLVYSYIKTFGFPATIVRCSNNYVPYQFLEKLIPLVTTNAMEDNTIPVYGDGMNVRDWIYVEDFCSAIFSILEKGRSGEVYNVGCNSEKNNLEVIRTILACLNKPESLITFVADRLGHDRRYAMDAAKLRNTGCGQLRGRPKLKFPRVNPLVRRRGRNRFRFEFCTSLG